MAAIVDSSSNKMNNDYLQNIFLNIEQQKLFIELVNQNTIDIFKLFSIVNIDIEKIYEIAIRLDLRIVYDYAVCNLVKPNIIVSLV